MERLSEQEQADPARHRHPHQQQQRRRRGQDPDGGQEDRADSLERGAAGQTFFSSSLTLRQNRSFVQLGFS